MTAAHRHLRFGSRVRVRHLQSGREVTVTINDRGPFRKGRIIDLSRDAARALGMTKQGIARVRITLLD
ncbi:MAG: septal ring lytic transglycosylase RlpA family protein [Rhodomicrobium sp.]|nr:septal ring lytic transglycosylase RlpA family protein [Rhodomicrobium sp.]